MPMRARVAILRTVSERLMERLDDLIAADMPDTGRSYWQACNFAGARAIGPFNAYCDLACRLKTPPTPSTCRAGCAGFR